MSKTNPKKKHAEELMEMFRYAYNESSDHFKRMSNAHRSYQGKINVSAWPTKSRISFPFSWNAVEEQLPFAMTYQFPSGHRWPTLIPEDNRITPEALERVEDYMRHLLMVPMRMMQVSYLIMKDCVRYAVGYGLSDYGYVSSPQVNQKALYRKDQRISTRIDVVHSRKLYPIIRYIHPARVIPMPDGSETDGPARTDHFVLLTFSEDEFKRMMKDDNRYSTDVDVGTIINEARNMGCEPNMHYQTIMSRIAGIKASGRVRDEEKCLVPVLIYYGLKEKTYLALGKYIIRQIKAEGEETIASDLIKFSAWPDGEEWFPVGPYEASETVGVGANIWYNAMVDLAAYMINPQRVVNRTMFGNNAVPPTGPGQDLEVYGDPNKAMQFAQLPQFPQQLFAMGDILQEQLGKTVGHPSQLDKMSPGLVRGGVNALETVLATSTGRQLLAAIMLKTGGIQDAIAKTLIKAQMLATDEGSIFTTRRYNPNTGKDETAEHNVTMEDLFHVFRVQMNVPAAKFNSASAQAEKWAFFDRAVRTPEYFDMHNLFEYVLDDVEAIQRVMLPRDVVEQRQQENYELQRQNAQAQAQAGQLKAQKLQEATSQAQQAQAGQGVEM